MTKTPIHKDAEEKQHTPLDHAKTVSASMDVNPNRISGLNIEQDVMPIVERLNTINRHLQGKSEYSVASQLSLCKRDDGAVELKLDSLLPIDPAPLLRSLYLHSASTGHVAGIWEGGEQVGMVFASGMETLARTLDKAEAALSAKKISTR